MLRWHSPVAGLRFEVDFPASGEAPAIGWRAVIYSWHGDFIADWDNQVQNALVASCLNIPHECADMNRDGDTLFRPSYDPDPITIDLTKFSNTSPYAGQTLQGPVTSTSSASAHMSMPMP